jgi:hypothetical protein
MTGNALFQFPNAVAVDIYENVYIVSEGTPQIRKINPYGIVTTISTMDINGNVYTFISPKAIAAESRLVNAPSWCHRRRRRADQPCPTPSTRDLTS